MSVKMKSQRQMMLTRLSFFLIAFSEAVYAVPDWAKKQGSSLHGSTYRAVCSGEGPAVDIARTEAIQSCKASASGMCQHFWDSAKESLRNFSTQVRTLTAA
jgi:hypothetical protein